MDEDEKLTENYYKNTEMKDLVQEIDFEYFNIKFLLQKICNEIVELKKSKEIQNV